MANKYQFQTVRYNPLSAHPLHTLDVCYTDPTDAALWVIFIHGGAWCDPAATKTEGHPLLTHLLTRFPGSLLNAASIDYRLSRHPTHASVGETVTHPAHANDVQDALRFLNDKYQMWNYIFIGHSAGAALCFQTLIFNTLLAPKAVVGLAGIYDLGALVKEYPQYRSFVEAAFGGVGAQLETRPWDHASPAKNLACNSCNRGIDIGYRMVLMRTTRDELLSGRQTELMGRAIGQRLVVGGLLETVVGDFGRHSEMLRNGRVWEVLEGVVREALNVM